MCCYRRLPIWLSSEVAATAAARLRGNLVRESQTESLDLVSRQAKALESERQMERSFVENAATEFAESQSFPAAQSAGSVVIPVALLGFVCSAAFQVALSDSIRCPGGALRHVALDLVSQPAWGQA